VDQVRFIAELVFAPAVVIARQGGRSSNRKILRGYWMPRFRGA
jgi:hypothetical protein